jgi:hypothetical protein
MSVSARTLREMPSLQRIRDWLVEHEGFDTSIHGDRLDDEVRIIAAAMQSLCYDRADCITAIYTDETSCS